MNTSDNNNNDQVRKPGRKPSGNGGTFNTRIPVDVAKFITERYGNSENERLNTWIKNNLAHRFENKD